MPQSIKTTKKRRTGLGSYKSVWRRKMCRTVMQLKMLPFCFPNSPDLCFAQKCVMGDVVAVRTYVKDAWWRSLASHVGCTAGWRAQFNERNAVFWFFPLYPHCCQSQISVPLFSNMTLLVSFGIVVVIWIKMSGIKEKKQFVRMMPLDFVKYINDRSSEFEFETNGFR